MGTIRTLLAVAVVFTHTYGFVFVGGRLAVQLFYIISGFLISFVLIQSNTYRKNKDFYINRFYRLFPIYWTVIILSFFYIITLALLNQNHEIIETFNEINNLGKISLLLTNILLIGQDLVMFMGVNDSNLEFTSNFRDSEIEVWKGLLAPQAWTLSLEIFFYLIAPFLLIKKRLIFAFLLISLLIRFYLIKIGIGTRDPWTYRFFPAELALFLLGAISHQLWLPFLKRKNMLGSNSSRRFTITILIYCSIFFLLPYRGINTLVLLSLFLVSLPYLFTFQKENKWDRYIGDLSYPIYISHFLIIWFMRDLSVLFPILNPTSISGSIFTIIITILFSILLNITLGKMVNLKREEVKKRQIITKS